MQLIFTNRNIDSKRSKHSNRSIDATEWLCSSEPHQSAWRLVQTWGEFLTSVESEVWTYSESGNTMTLMVPSILYPPTVTNANAR